MRKTRFIAAAVIATAALSAGVGSASAAGPITNTQLVNGVPLGTLALGVPAPSPFVFTSFGPGVNATGLGTVLVTSTNAWTLKVGDHDATVHTAGHMYNTGAALCPAGAEAQTANALTVASAGVAPGTSGVGSVTVNGTDQTIATGAVTDTVTNTIGMNVGSTEPMGTGCTYSDTLTYTLQ